MVSKTRATTIGEVANRYQEYFDRLVKRRRPAAKNKPRNAPIRRIRFIDTDDLTTHAEALEFMDWVRDTLRALGYTATTYLDSFDIESSYYTYLHGSVNNDRTGDYRMRDKTRIRFLALRADIEHKVTQHNMRFTPVELALPAPRPVPDALTLQLETNELLRTLNTNLLALACEVREFMKVWS